MANSACPEIESSQILEFNPSGYDPEHWQEGSETEMLCKINTLSEKEKTLKIPPITLTPFRSSPSKGLSKKLQELKGALLFHSCLLSIEKHHTQKVRSSGFITNLRLCIHRITTNEKPCGLYVSLTETDKSCNPTKYFCYKEVKRLLSILLLWKYNIQSFLLGT